MADTGKPDGTEDGTDDGPDGGPSLQMPSFSLRRRRKAPVGDPEAPPAAVRPAATRPADVPTAAMPALEPHEPRAHDEPAEPEPRRRRELPTIALAGLPAAAATGVAVGALAVLLTWLATATCEVVRGTSSCGGGPGLLILVAVLVVLSYAGSLLLRVLTVPDAGSTSVLAVGILTVLVLVFLLGSIDEWWMAVAIPVAAVIAFCASWWVTTAVVATDPRAHAVDEVSREPRDVR